MSSCCSGRMPPIDIESLKTRGKNLGLKVDAESNHSASSETFHIRSKTPIQKCHCTCGRSERTAVVNLCFFSAIRAGNNERPRLPLQPQQLSRPTTHVLALDDRHQRLQDSGYVPSVAPEEDKTRLGLFQVQQDHTRHRSRASAHEPRSRWIASWRIGLCVWRNKRFKAWRAY